MTIQLELNVVYKTKLGKNIKLDKINEKSVWGLYTDENGVPTGGFTATIENVLKSLENKNSSNKFTNKETEILNAIIKGSESRTVELYHEAIIKEDWISETWVDMSSIFENTEMNKNEIGGVLSSLESKMAIEFLDAKEYSLGCNCWAIYKDIVLELMNK